jgi:two-component system, NarL family, response regulator NreC
MATMNIRVLIVDDHQIFREGLRSMIEKKPGITVVGEAESGKTAMKLARELLPDIIIMDIVMPDMNGIETTRHLADSLPQIKIIGLSMHDDVRFATEMLKAGASGFLLKDCAFEELIDAINTVGAENVYLSPKTREDMIRDYIALLSKGGQSSVSALSAREQEVLRLIAEGKSTKEIAAHLGVSVKTIETHRLNIMEKLGIKNMAELVKYAIRQGLSSL